MRNIKVVRTCGSVQLVVATTIAVLGIGDWLTTRDEDRAHDYFTLEPDFGIIGSIALAFAVLPLVLLVRLSPDRRVTRAALLAVETALGLGELSRLPYLVHAVPVESAAWLLFAATVIGMIVGLIRMTPRTCRSQRARR